ncbi:MAG: hypothetical protein HC939_11075 [Pleurocapsa sp. SU_5_0]|nr:hypothetical protein [Pleurocapsa sp. SU_5_0]NJR45527.1 hypothetical protein [Hyellaceae cyanobacterium CSU_1_1]
MIIKKSHQANQLIHYEMRLIVRLHNQAVRSHWDCLAAFFLLIDNKSI